MTNPQPQPPQPPPSMPDEPYYQRPNRGDQVRRLGGILLVIGVIWLVFELARRILFGAISFVASEQSLNEPLQTFNGATALRVETTPDNVTIYGHDQAAITVESRRRGFGWNENAAREALERVEVQVSREGERVTVIVQRPPNIFNFGAAPLVDLRIGVPRGVALDLRTVSGDLSLEQVEGQGVLTSTSGAIKVKDSGGMLRFYTTSGTIELEDFSGRHELQTVSGAIEVRGGAIESLAAESVSGDLQINTVTGDVRAKTISGQIIIKEGQAMVLDLESTSGDIDVAGSLALRRDQRLHSVSGDISLRIAEPSDLRIEMTTLSGDLESELELEQLVEERRRLSGIMGSGDTSLLISTTSGDVVIAGQ